MKKTILITCVGSGVGQSVIDSLNIRGEYKLIGCDTNQNVYAYSYCDDFFEVPGIYSTGYVDFIIELCIKESVDLVVPGHDHELLMFSTNIDKFKNNNIEVIVSKSDLIEISRDKKMWYDYFFNLGCRIVPTFWVKEFKQNPDTSIFPAIIKPAGGSASQGISILNDLSELEFADDKNIIQPYLFPETTDENYNAIHKAVKAGKFTQLSEISIQLVFSKSSKLVSIFISKNTLKNGVPIFVDPIKPKDFEHLDEILKFVPILERKGVVGPVNIQGRVTSRGLFFFEMNMRFTGITGNRALLGFNEVDYLVNDFLGRPAKLGEFAYNKLGIRQVACATMPRKESTTEKTYTLLGAGGFVGSYYINFLVERGKYEFINLICRDDSFENYVSRFSSERVKVFKASDSFVETIYCQTDVLINFVGALAYYSDKQKFDSIIFQYEQVQKLRRANIPIVINVSSQSVYDQGSDEVKNEQNEVSLDTVYAFQKYICELFFSSISRFNPMVKTISLRFSRVVGGTDRKVNGFFAKAVDALLNNQQVIISHPQNKTNIIDIRDAVSSIDFIIENLKEKNFPEVLNVGGVNLSLENYCQAIIKELNDPTILDLIKYSDTNDVVASSMIDSSIISSLGWKPSYTVEDLLRGYIDSANKI